LIIIVSAVEACEYALLLSMFDNGGEGLDWLLISSTYMVLDGGYEGVNGSCVALTEVVIADLYPLWQHLREFMKVLDDHHILTSGLRRSTEDGGLCPTDRTALNGGVVNELMILPHVVAN
jgi:hypothetical protein